MSEHDVDRDFTIPDLSIDPPAFSPYRETLRIIDRMLALMDRIIEENGVGS